MSDRQPEGKGLISTASVAIRKYCRKNAELCFVTFIKCNKSNLIWKRVWKFQSWNNQTKENQTKARLKCFKCYNGIISTNITFSY